MSNFKERLKSCVDNNDLTPVLAEMLSPDHYYKISPDLICMVPLHYTEETIRLFRTTHTIDAIPDFVDVCIMCHVYDLVKFLCEQFTDVVLKCTKLGNMFLEQEEYVMAFKYYSKAFDEDGHAPVDLYAGVMRCSTICGDDYIRQSSRNYLKLSLTNTRYPHKDFPLRLWSVKYALTVDTYVSGNYRIALDMCTRLESYMADVCPDSMLLLDTLLLKGKCYLFENDVEAATDCFSRAQRIASKYMDDSYSKLDEAAAFLCICNILSGSDYPDKLDNIIMKHSDHLADRLSVFKYANTKDADILTGVFEYYIESVGEDCYFVKLLSSIANSDRGDQ